MSEVRRQRREDSRVQAPAGKREDKVERGREKTKTTRREGEKAQRQRQMPAAKRWRERKGPSRV